MKNWQFFLIVLGLSLLLVWVLTSCDDNQTKSPKTTVNGWNVEIKTITHDGCLIWMGVSNGSITMMHSPLCQNPKHSREPANK